MKKQPLFTKEQLENYVAEGKRSRDIATETGVNDRTIRWYFRKYNLAVPKWKPHRVWNKGLKASEDERVRKSVEAANKATRGSIAWNNKGGFINEYGYRIIYVNGRRKREHVHIIEHSIGRKLKPNECVHHKDEDKLNNDLENLQLMTKSEHGKLHYPKGSKFGIHK